AENGRISVGMTFFNKPPPFGDPAYQYHVWHEKADATMLDVNIFGGTRTPAQKTANEISRTDDTTYVLDSLGGSGALDLFTIIDTGSSEQSGIQSISGSPSRMYIDTDPAAAANVYWGLLSSNNRIYYGDNYGTANGGSQFVDAGAAVSEMTGV